MSEWGAGRRSCTHRMRMTGGLGPAVAGHRAWCTASAGCSPHGRGGKLSDSAPSLGLGHSLTHAHPAPAPLQPRFPGTHTFCQTPWDGFRMKGTQKWSLKVPAQTLTPTQSQIPRTRATATPGLWAFQGWGILLVLNYHKGEPQPAPPEPGTDR